MTTRAEYGALLLEDRVARLERTPRDLAAAIQGRDERTLSRRPKPGAWAAKEVVCHLRDLEEQFILRFRMMLAIDDPKFLTLGDMPPNPSVWGLQTGDGPPLDPDRWAEERQYLNNDADAALAAFTRRREETLAFLRRLAPAQWERGSIHTTHGRMTYGDWVSLMAAHDDKHVAQIIRALSAPSGP